MAAAAAQAVGAATSTTTVLGPVVQLSRRRRSGRRHGASGIPNLHSLTDTSTLGIVDDRPSAVQFTREADPRTNLLLKATHTAKIDGEDSLQASRDDHHHHHHYYRPSTAASASAGGRRVRSSTLAMVSVSAIAGALSATTAAVAVFPARAEEVLAALPLESAFPAISLPSESGFPAISLPTDILGVDPAIAAGGAIALAIPAVVVALLSRPAAKEVTPEEALRVLSDVEGSVLLDVRDKSIVDQDGSPSLRKLKKKVTMVAFEIQDEGTFVEDPEFESKVAAKTGFEDKASATVVVIDRSGQMGKKAANKLAKAGYSNVLFVKGGAELWKTEGLPWKVPSRAPFKVDIEAIKEAIDNTVKENPNIVPTTLGVAAAAGASAVFLTEVETTMQVIGSLALLQFLVRKFLFAKDRKQTLEEIEALLSSRAEFMKGLQNVWFVVHSIPAAAAAAAVVVASFHQLLPLPLFMPLSIQYFIQLTPDCLCVLLLLNAWFVVHSIQI
ncbi:hypothetical protein CBR_g40436 [Chara braunii]|uniref:Rhodanese domain-containing protein n=1 Tax=Chara braunii TaxID=69332 RepID=A0A388LTS2_CHABU|nr:hypothetical protein CBR_g40436 [Chara braunii]|eukprot:GBG85707.1 hypothetical protein CBR_g40436 [Chara braunii]